MRTTAAWLAARSHRVSRFRRRKYKCVCPSACDPPPPHPHSIKTLTRESKPSPTSSGVCFFLIPLSILPFQFPPRRDRVQASEQCFNQRAEENKKYIYIYTIVERGMIHWDNNLRYKSTNYILWIFDINIDIVFVIEGVFCSIRVFFSIGGFRRWFEANGESVMIEGWGRERVGGWLMTSRGYSVVLGFAVSRGGRWSIFRGRARLLPAATITVDNLDRRVGSKIRIRSIISRRDGFNNSSYDRSSVS